MEFKGISRTIRPWDIYDNVHFLAEMTKLSRLRLAIFGMSTRNLVIVILYIIIYIVVIRHAYLNDNIGRPIHKCMSDNMFTCRAYSVCTVHGMTNYQGYMLKTDSPIIGHAF